MTGNKIYINLYQIVEMVRTPFGTAYIVLSNGETHPVTDSQASSIENFFEGK
jgi:hypothetical protein